MEDRNAADPRPLPDDVVATLQRGRKLEAIKLLRVARGLELKEAKDCIEHYIAADPALAKKMAVAQAEAKRGCLLWFAALVVLAVLAYGLLAAT